MKPDRAIGQLDRFGRSEDVSIAESLFPRHDQHFDHITLSWKVSRSGYATTERDGYFEIGNPAATG
jgi:hypothetical protein